MRAGRGIAALTLICASLAGPVTVGAADMPDPASYAERYNQLHEQIRAADLLAADAATRRPVLLLRAARLRARIDRYVAGIYRDARLPVVLPDLGAHDAGARHYFAAAVGEKDEVLDRYRRVEADLAVVERQAVEAAEAGRRAQREVAVVKAWLDANPGTVRDAQSHAESLPNVPAPNPGAEIARAYAAAQLGKPYRYGATGPATFDCSGLTMRAWAAAGVPLTHYSAAQLSETQRISRDQLEVGDLVFLGPGGRQHVAMFVGAGMVISAPHTGSVVRVQPIYDNATGYGRVHQYGP